MARGRLRVAVVGGSLGGLTAALVLRDAGCAVEVFERSASELFGYGAGIVVHDATVRYFRERTAVSLDELSVGVGSLRYLDREGSVVYEEPSSYRFTAWSTLYRNLLRIFGEESYRRGEALVGFEQDGQGVDVRFADGREERYDLLVCADGVQSIGRRLLLRDVAPAYSGYVGWRGTVAETHLSPAAFAVLRNAITYAVLERSHILAYPIPNVDGTLEPGSRLINFVWYRNVPAGSELDALMTDRAGFPRLISLPPGEVQARYVHELHEAAAAALPPTLAELVVTTERPFVQVVVDVEVPRMAVGRVCLIGDAAFVARPHAAAGTAKAAEDAWKLAEAVGSSEGDIVPALRGWSERQVALGRRLVERTRAMGERSQRHGTWQPGDPELRFGLYGPGR